MNKRLLAIILIIILFAAGCSSPVKETVESKPRQATNTPVPDLLGREKLSAYTATFLIDFDGPVKWKYQLITRKAPTLREVSLHIEGIEGPQNPGDVRMVTDGVTTWMIGPGTDNECVQYPNNTGMDPNLVYPEALISMQSLPSLAKYVRDEPAIGRESSYYVGGPMKIGKWENASVEYHQEKASGALLQFAMLAGGDDILFNTGKGTMLASYSIDSFDTPAIEPVTGCEIAAPLSPGARDMVRLPGLASFASPDGVEAVRGFYQAELPADGWNESEAPGQSDGVLVLSYERGDDRLEIHIESASPGSTVKIMLFDK